MSPASGPVQEPKLHPAATMDDQQKVEEGSVNPIVLGPVPFSSPDPVTDAQKMLPLEDGTSAYDAGVEAAAARKQANYDDMKKDELVNLATERGLDTEGKKADELRDALREDDTSDMKASDFKAQVEAATTQEELDEAANLYSGSGKSFSSVESAIEKKQNEINESAGSSS